jgi:hypothetical protein
MPLPRRQGLLALLALVLSFVVSCGGGSSGGGGSTPQPAVSVSPASLTFSSESVGITSAAQTVTLTNTGSASLAISSIAVSGAFAETNTCGGSVAASGTCTISVTFTPTGAGSFTGTVSITDDASGSPQAVQLAGTGAGATLSWKDAETFGSGDDAAYGITILNGTNLIVVGVGNLNQETQTLSSVALSYTLGGTVNSNKYVGPPTTEPTGFLTVGASGSIALAGGSNTAGTASVSDFDQNVNLTASDYCPSTQYAGAFAAIATTSNTAYLGIDRNPTTTPAITEADASGNINCTALIGLPFTNPSARIGSIVATSSFLIVTGDEVPSTSTASVVGWVAKLGLDGTVQAQQQFNNIVLPRAVAITESGSIVIYLVGSLNPTASPYDQPIWVNKLDSGLNQVARWPLTWDGDNPDFVDSQGNKGDLVSWGNAIVANPAASGGIIAVGQITGLPPNTDPNYSDIGIIAYGPTGTVLWKTRQSFYVKVTCNAAVVQGSFLYVVGAINNSDQTIQQSLTTAFTLPN